jgi:hypothetical protein
MNIGQWVKTNKLTEEQVAIAEELNGRGIETFTDAVFAIGEPALAIISSSVADPIAGLAGIGMSAFDGVARGTDTINNVKNALSYVPKTRAGKVGMKAVADTLQPVSDALTGAEDYLGSNTLELTGSPFLAAAAATIPTALAELNPLGKVSRQADKMGIFAGKGAKTADLNRQEMANELLSRGVGRDEIYKETGWFKDVDEQWKFEIDDSDFSTITKEFSDTVDGYDERMNLIGNEFGLMSPEAKVLRAEGRSSGVENKRDIIFGRDAAFNDLIQHDSLVDAYPATVDMQASFNLNKDIPDPSGMFDSRMNRLEASGNIEGINTTALHELQHSVQEREGFAKGGSPEEFDLPKKLIKESLDNWGKIRVLRKLGDNQGAEIASSKFEQAFDRKPTKMELDLSGSMKIDEIDGKINELKMPSFDKYQRLAGEAEARNVQARMSMTPAERIANPPWTTLDVPESELIIKK